MTLSAVAAVLDGYGGWHTVVAPPDSFHHHVRPGQILLVVPDFHVEEPIPQEHFSAIARQVVRRAEQHILWWIKTRNDPEILKDPAVTLFLLRRKRGYHRDSVSLHQIVET